MKTNFFKHLLTLAMLIPFMGLVSSCHNTADDEIAQLPYLGIVNDTKELTFVMEGETQTIDLESSRAWEITNIPDWVSVTPTSGSGNGSISITTAPNTGAAREGTITLTLKNATGYATTIKITQNGTAAAEPIYYEDCGTTVEKDANNYWPYVDAFTGWSRKGSLDQSAVTYSGTSSSVRNSGSGYEPNGDTPTGAPYEYMANATAVFQINSINVTGKTNLTLNFYAQHQSVYSPQTFSAISSSTIKLQAGFDGTNWADLTFTSDGASGWSLVTSEFQVPSGTTTLYLKYSNFVGGGDNQLRIDDIKLLEGGNGALITPGGGVTPPPSGTSVNISTITATGSYQVEGTVSALCTRGFIVSDATGSILYYGGTTYVDGSYAIGDKVTISGAVSTYNKGYQFDNTATVTKTATGSYTYPTPTSYTSTEVDAFVANTADRLATYVTYTGTLTISGTYYNVAVSGTTNQGSFYFPISSISSALTTGTNVTVKGYAITVSSSKYVNTVVTSVTAAGASDAVSATPTTLSWAATATDAKTVTVTSSGAWTAAIDNSTDFTITPTSGVSGGTFTVTPAAANTTATAKTATVTLTCGTATTTIAVSQAATTVGDAVSTTPTTLSWANTATDAKTVTVTSSGAWTAAIDNSTDFTITPTSGVSGGTFTVTPTAANTTTTAKTATVTLTCGTATTTISCSQAAATSGTMTGIPATWDFNTATLASDLINATSGNTNATISAVGVSGLTIAGTSIKYPTATAWTTSSYWLITIPVTNFAANTTVNLAYEQRSSNTGPKNFVSEYSTDGGTTWTESGTVTPMNGTDYITENVDVVVANAIASGNLLIRIRVSNTDSAKGDGTAIASGGANRLSGGSFAVTIK